MALSGPGNWACCPGFAQVFAGSDTLPQWGLGNDLAFLYLCTAGFARENPLPPHAAVVVEASGEDISFQTQALALFHGIAVLGPHPAIVVWRVDWDSFRAQSFGVSSFPADGHG